MLCSCLKFNKRTIRSYKNLSRYIRHLCPDIGLGKKIDMEQIKKGYFGLVENNPRRIVAFGSDPW
jgi:glutathionyl-hydroquinone reductase